MDYISLALNPPRFARFRKKPPIRLRRSPSPVWPLPSLNGRAPVVLDAATDRAQGIELAYPRLDDSDAVDVCPPNTPNGTATHLMPQMAAALAVDDGVITFAGQLDEGLWMIIDHGNGYASHYANLQAMCAIRTDLYRPREQCVYAGDTIGYVGAPAKGAFKRLYFELWKREKGRFSAIDPTPHLAAWKLVEHFDRFAPAPPAVTKEVDQP